MMAAGDTRLQAGCHREPPASHRPRHTVHVAGRRPALPHRQRASAAGMLATPDGLYIR